MTVPELLYLLRTADSSGKRLLDEFDNTRIIDLSEVLNVDLNDDKWLQASLPVGNGAIRSAQMLAPSAFLESAASTLIFIIPDSIGLLKDQDIVSGETKWSSLSGSALPAVKGCHIQKARTG